MDIDLRETHADTDFSNGPRWRRTSMTSAVPESSALSKEALHCMALLLRLDNTSTVYALTRATNKKKLYDVIIYFET